MTPQPQHPQRCETCERFPCDAIKEASKTISSVVISEMLQSLLKDFTALVGCASHSSAGAQQQPKYGCKEGYTPELKFRCGQQRDIKDPDCSKCSSGILLSDADRCYICGKKFERGITVHRDSQGWRHPDTDPRCHTPTGQPEAQQRIEQAIKDLEEGVRISERHWDDDGEAHSDLRRVCKKAIALLQAGDGK